MTHKWNYLPITSEQTEASQRLAQELGISPILGELLVERGITTAAAAKKFFRPQLPDLYDPFLMKDMDVAVERLNKAMGKKERILIYGDYDVDGTTAVALVYKFIQQFYSNIDYYIPDRYNEGYGVSTKGVDYAAETGFSSGTPCRPPKHTHTAPTRSIRHRGSLCFLSARRTDPSGINTRRCRSKAFDPHPS